MKSTVINGDCVKLFTVQWRPLYLLVVKKEPSSSFFIEFPSSKPKLGQGIALINNIVYPVVVATKSFTIFKFAVSWSQVVALALWWGYDVHITNGYIEVVIWLDVDIPFTVLVNRVGTGIPRWWEPSLCAVQDHAPTNCRSPIMVRQSIFIECGNLPWQVLPSWPRPKPGGQWQ